MRYQSPDEDSGRWDGFPFRQGDVVISTRSKSGTTWMQMICALLIFQTPDLPAPLPTLSPWLDWLIVPRDEVIGRLEAQRHRRFIKTHTPLDGIPIDPGVTYIVVARHPLDMAVSLFHQGDNLNRERIAELASAEKPRTDEPRTDKPGMSGDGPAAPGGNDDTAGTRKPSVHDSVLRWIDRDVAPADSMDSLPGVMWHLTDAWRRQHAGGGQIGGRRRGDTSQGEDYGQDDGRRDDRNGRPESNVLLVHYADLSTDLESEMRRIAAELGIDVPEDRWPALVKAAGFEHMRQNADHLAPDPAGIMKDRNAFFRRGSSGAGRELLTDAELTHYEERARSMAPPDLLKWLHR
jgi:hypothetical protein